MGLDMYLNAKKFVRSYKPGVYPGPDYTGPDVDAEAKAQYNGVLEAAGIGSLKIPADQREFGGLTVDARVAYWRKANQIFAWFEREVCEGECENCKEYEVTLDQLRELRDTCKRVLADHELAEALLPTQSGFFFGDTAYDQYYFADLEDTVTMLDKILGNHELAEETDFEYHAWW
jgi:hypothetical protein